MQQRQLPQHFLHHSLTGRSNIAHSLSHHAGLNFPFLEVSYWFRNKIIKVLLEDTPVLGGDHVVVGG